LNAGSCPDFTSIQTGVGVLPVPSGMAVQLHHLHHNWVIRTGGAACSTPAQFVERNVLTPSRAPPGGRPIQRHHPPPQNRSPAPPAPRPPPSDSFSAFIKQWERLLVWATFKTLLDFKVMPTRPARAASGRLAKRILSDYGPALHKWLGPPG